MRTDVIDKSIQERDDEFQGAQVKMESCTFSLWKENHDRQGVRGSHVSLFADKERRGLDLLPRLPKPRLPRMILFSLCCLLFLHRVTSKGKAPHREQDVIGGLLSILWTIERYAFPPPTVSCQEINMWHGISGGRRRHVGHEAKINKSFNDKMSHIK